jgi:hypothetical protein
VKTLTHLLRSAGSAAMAGAIFLPLASCNDHGRISYARATNDATLFIALALPALFVVAGLIFVRLAKLLAALNFAAGLFALEELYLTALGYDKWLFGGYLALAGLTLVLVAGILATITAIIGWCQRRLMRPRAKSDGQKGEEDRNAERSAISE